MFEFLRTVRDLCQFKHGPQDLPYSPDLLTLLMGGSVVMDLAIATMVGFESSVLLPSIVSLALILGLTWSALSLRGLTARFVQTAMALLACAMLFNLLLIPLALSIGKLPTTPEQLTGFQMLLVSMELVLALWKLSVDAHILRHALSLSFGFGFLLALSWAVVDRVIQSVLFGVAH